MPEDQAVTISIDGHRVTVPAGKTIFDAARSADVFVPVLCHREMLTPDGTPLPQAGVCRVCAVEVVNNGRPERVLAAACCRTVSPGMEVFTTGQSKGNYPDKPFDIGESRETIVEMLLAEHPRPCARHKEFGDCELELLGEKLGLLERFKPVADKNHSPKYELKSSFTPRAFSKGQDASNPSIAVDHAACILCDRCVRACASVENNVIGRQGKGYLTAISFDDDRPMGESSCVNCGECMISCPTGAITYSGGVPPAPPPGVTPLFADEVKKIPLFSKISSSFLARSEGAVWVKSFKKGEVICREGEFGSTAYYIDSGSVDIYLETDLKHVQTKAQGGFFKRMTTLLVGRGERPRAEEGDRRYIPIDANVDLDAAKPIATVGDGELIGEAACLNFQPRSATVRAREDTIVIEMLRNALDMLRKGREFRALMDAKYRERALGNHLRSAAVFRELPDAFIDYLRDRVKLVSFTPGQVICRQGEAADAFYLVRMGHVKVEQSYADGQTMVLSYLSRSQYFGEIGLLGLASTDPALAGMRTATCTALDHVEVVRIDRDEFDAMLEQFPAVRTKLRQVAEDRLAANRVQTSAFRTLSLPQYINQGLYEAQSLLILDLEKCTRCDECVKACAQAHDGVSRLIRDGLRFDKYLVTTSCRSCRDPMCMIGCPVGSIRRKGDKEIIIEDHCIGCGRCAEQCPYGNISLHPFEMTMTDLSTGQKRKEERRKAAVCDLCVDQCLDEYDVPSCVYACPHDAAHRVDGQTFFDVNLFGENVIAEKTRI